MSDRQIELTWRCSSCQHQNLGRDMVCQSCGNPKDDSEEYEMPADPSAVASVEDPALLRMAAAGEHWKCAYCGSNQRDLDGGCVRCGAGRKEGANVRPGPPTAVGDPSELAVAPRRFGLAHRVLVAILGVSLLIGSCVVIGGVAGRRRPTPPVPIAVPIPIRMDFTGQVTAVSWTRTITVEKWQLAPHEDFTSDVPAGAVDVRAAGQHVHHHEDVHDHDETVYDDVEVPDGYRTETSSERVACGEDCTSSRTCKRVCTRSSRTCKQVCTNKKNGFASCRDECTGGDETCRDDCSGSERKCTTKYCNQTRTRQVAKTRTERRPRVVKKYRSEPRYAAWSTFKSWEWVALRTVEDSGDDASPRWPDAGVTAAGERAAAADGGPRSGAEREVRHETFRATIKTDDGASHAYMPSSEEELARLTPGASLKVRVVSGTLTLL